LFRIFFKKLKNFFSFSKRAAFKSEAIGNRHLIVSSDRLIPTKMWADILSEEFSSKGFKFPTELDNQVPHGNLRKKTMIIIRCLLILN
jgi:hypothetical protein